MANSIQNSNEPTIWALRKQGLLDERSTHIPSLFEHLYGYDPIRILGKLSADPAEREALSKGAATNPRLNIIDAETRFAVAEIASDLPPDQT